MYLLLLSLGALALGPFLYQAARRFRKAFRFFDIALLIAIVVLVLFDVLPESIEHAGFYAVGAAGLGFLGPFLLSRFFHSDCEIHPTIWSLASAGVIAHAILDGMALASVETGLQDGLGIAILLHRLPEGMAIWRIVHPRLGLVTTTLALLAAAGATTLGFFFGESLFHGTSEHTLVIFQAMMGGILLHVLLHGNHLKELEKDELVEAAHE